KARINARASPATIITPTLKSAALAEFRPHGRKVRAIQCRVSASMGLIVAVKKLLPKTVKRTVKPLLPSWLRYRVEDARAYVGTDTLSGQLQFELLKREGCRPDSKVLEIGCGNLHAGVPLMQFLEKGRYVGMDLNKWLRQSRMKDPS